MELSTQAALVIAGVALVIAGILGIGIKFGTLIVPKLAGWKQAVLVVAGFLLIALGVSLTPEFYTTLWNRTPEPTPTATATESPVSAAGATSPTVEATATQVPATATALVTDTPPQSPTLPAKFIVQEVANLRSGPSTDYPLIGSAALGQELDIIGRTADGQWWLICCSNGQQAWIFGELGRATREDVAIVVSALPPQLPESASTPVAADAPTKDSTSTPTSLPVNTAVSNTPALPVSGANSAPARPPTPAPPPTSTPVPPPTNTPVPPPTDTPVPPPTDTPVPPPTDTPPPTPDSRGMDVTGWCQRLGYASAVVAGTDVYSWQCQASDGSQVGLDLSALCSQTYGDNYQPEYGDFNDPYSWKCVAH